MIKIKIIYISKIKLSIILLIIILTLTHIFTNFNNKTIQTSLNSIYTSTEKIAYLTFDDGPTKKVTPKILDILANHNIKATFFVLGVEVEQNPDILKRIYDNGHTIGNHGYSHNNSKLYASKESFINEINKTDEAIGKALNIKDYHCKIFRFPNGSQSKSYFYEKQQAIKWLDEINYDYIDWNALTKDSEQKYSNYELLQNLKNTVKGKGTIVVLMHDTGDVNNTYDMLEDSIEYLIAEGYDFKAL